MSRYDDIIHLPRPVSQRHAHMSLCARAAQFAPFAALTGYEAVIAETERLTDHFVELDGEAIEALNRQLLRIADRLPQCPTVTATYFLPDERKSGGSYREKTGQVKKLDTTFGVLLFADRTEIPLSQLLTVCLLE